MTNEQILDLFAMVEPADVIAILGIEDEHCAVADCTAPTAGITVVFNADGELAIAPICKAHAEAEAAVAKAFQFDAYKALPLLQVVCSRAIQRLIEADIFPFVARTPGNLEYTALFLRNKEGVVGFVPIVMPFEEGDVLVARADSLQFMVDSLLEGKSLSFMGSTADHRLLMVESDMSDFIPFGGEK